MTDDLVKELRKAAYRNPGDWVCDMCGEAADRIEALITENERLREALAAYLHGADEGYVSVEVDRAARAALGDTQ